MSHRHLGQPWSSHTTWQNGSDFQSTKNGWRKTSDGRILELVFAWEADSEVTVDAFMPHSHPGGECYLVLKGEVWDEDGSYPTGSIVWMNRETTHTPKTRGKTLILVLWPEGVKSV